MSAGMESVAVFAGSVPGQFLLSLGLALVVACLCADMVRVLSAPRSRPRFVASTAFRTLAVPSVLATGASVLVHAVSWSWTDIAMGVFVIVVIVFRWHHNTDEDNWWKGRGQKLARWARKQLAPRPATVPVMG